MDKVRAGLGVHLDDNDKPFAEVTLDHNIRDNITVTISLELFEMLVDPLGSYLRVASDLDLHLDKNLVRYLVEVWDPCEMYLYAIGDTLVSDFIKPEFYNVNSLRRNQYDLLSKLDQPLDVPRGGYISYQDPNDNHLHQKTPRGYYIDIGVIHSNKNPHNDRDSKEGEKENNPDEIRNLGPI
jgi:hypothetical protein